MLARGAKEYDVIVIGSGSGTALVEYALNDGMRVALVDRGAALEGRGPVGGTCLNVGCIPSKLLIATADRVMEIEEAYRMGIKVTIESVDFERIMHRMRSIIDEDSAGIAQGLRNTDGLDFYYTTAHFVDAHTMQVDDQRITADKIFLVAGARPLIPPIRGLDEVPYLTNENVLRLERLPESLTIIGGGYIACEYAHFFAAMGSQVTILQRNRRLVPNEEPEISELLREKLGERMSVHVGTEVLAVTRDDSGHGYRLTTRDTGTDEEGSFSAEQILVATGRRSNADLLQVENAGIETDDANYVIANEYLETNVEGIWAMGDITGRHMFKHVVNTEVSYAWHNSQHDHKVPMPYHAIPHAIFSYPQIASVGMTEAEARREHDVLVGHASYMDVTMGEAMMEIDGIAKAVVDSESRRILGFHIMGAQASTLIQEVINAMTTGEGIQVIATGLHIHPALPEVVQVALANLHRHD